MKPKLRNRTRSRLTIVEEGAARENRHRFSENHWDTHQNRSPSGLTGYFLSLSLRFRLSVLKHHAAEMLRPTNLDTRRSGEKFSQRRNHLRRQVEIDQQLQRAIFPRISSAAYSRAASISPASSHGKSLRISSFGAPAASKLRMSATVVRVPRMIGWPDRTAGLIAMRLFISGLTM